MTKLRIALGHSDFESIFEEDCIFVDKSLLIRDFLEGTNQTIVFPRPRRFGKTLNLSMLRYFFEKRPDGKDKQSLFHGLKIWSAGEKYTKEQGKYPVIFFSFKDVKSLNYESALAQIGQAFASLYSYHRYLVESDCLTEDEKFYFHRVAGLKANPDDLANGLRTLCDWLYRYHEQKVIVLLDEYDTPIHMGYFKDYFEEITSFMRTLLGGVFKDNPYLYKGVITGILRIAKENLFSGLNNVKVFSLLKDEYAEYFGFTQTEVDDLLERAELSKEREKVKAWYNGFQFGQTDIYNPWSILSFLQEEGQYFPYWVNTADNQLLQDTLAQSPSQVKQDMELLLQGETVTKSIDEYVVLRDIAQDAERVWSFLLFTGYLKVSNKVFQEDRFLCELCVPNQEIKAVYRRLIQDLFPATMPRSKYELMLKSLVAGDVALFEELLGDALHDSLSYFDVQGKHPEQFYHALVLGMLVGLQETHQVRSNRESGYGRYDVLVIPKDLSQLGFAIEFKTVKSEADLTEGVEKALQQIREKNYRQELEAFGVIHITELGIAFYGKQMKLGQC